MTTPRGWAAPRDDRWPDDYPDVDEVADDVILAPVASDLASDASLTSVTRDADLTSVTDDTGLARVAGGAGPRPAAADGDGDRVELPPANLTGNADVDRAIVTVRQVASRAPADQIDAYELVHQQLRDTLSSIDRAGQG